MIEHKIEHKMTWDPPGATATRYGRSDKGLAATWSGDGSPPASLLAHPDGGMIYVVTSGFTAGESAPVAEILAAKMEELRGGESRSHPLLAGSCPGIEETPAYEPGVIPRPSWRGRKLAEGDATKAAQRRRKIARAGLAILALVAGGLAAACFAGCSSLSDADAHRFALETSVVLEGAAPVDTLTAAQRAKWLALRDATSVDAAGILEKTKGAR